MLGIRMITVELSMKISCCPFVRGGRLLPGGKFADFDSALCRSDSSYPWFSSCTETPIREMHALKPRFVCVRTTPIPVVLLLRAHTEIGSSVVKPITVDVVKHFTFFRANNEPVHANSFPLYSRYCVAGSTNWRKSVPTYRRNKTDVRDINNGDTAVREMHFRPAHLCLVCLISKNCSANSTTCAIYSPCQNALPPLRRALPPSRRAWPPWNNNHCPPPRQSIASIAARPIYRSSAPFLIRITAHPANGSRNTAAPPANAIRSLAERSQGLGGHLRRPPLARVKRRHPLHKATVLGLPRHRQGHVQVGVHAAELACSGSGPNTSGRSS